MSPELSQALTGSRISSVDRRAKYLLFNMPHGRMMIHLGMSGSLRITDSGQPPRKHDHLDVVFADETVLRFHDPRRFGSIHWLPGNASHKLLDGLGPEPLGPKFDGDYLFRVSRRKKVAVKHFIMNSRVVVGVGNIYANEALFMSGIRPERQVTGISRARYINLADNIRRVLSKAIDMGGTTLRDFVREDGSPGYFRQQLSVYGRCGEACVSCGRKLREIRLGGRTTVFCTRCQH